MTLKDICICVEEDLEYQGNVCLNGLLISEGKDFAFSSNLLTVSFTTRGTRLDWRRQTPCLLQEP